MSSVHLLRTYALAIRPGKEEDIYVNDYLDLLDAQKKLEEWRYTYNHEHQHQTPGDKTPFEVYTSENKNLAPESVKVDRVSDTLLVRRYNLAVIHQ